MIFTFMMMNITEGGSSKDGSEMGTEVFEEEDVVHRADTAQHSNNSQGDTTRYWVYIGC